MSSIATDPDGKKSKLAEAVKNSKTRANLGALDMNSDKFKDMMDKKSRHSNLIDVRTSEVGFNKLLWIAFLCISTSI